MAFPITLASRFYHSLYYRTSRDTYIHPVVPPSVGDINIDVRNNEVDIDVDVGVDADAQAVDDTIVVNYIPNDGE